MAGVQMALHTLPRLQLGLICPDQLHTRVHNFPPDLIYIQVFVFRKSPKMQGITFLKRYIPKKVLETTYKTANHKH
jgi:hypothetical protein